MLNLVFFSFSNKVSFGPNSSLWQPFWSPFVTQSDRYCRLWSDANKVLVPQGMIISWSCHNELRHYCYRSELGKIVLIVPITALPVSRALAELGFLGWIGHSEFERLLIVFGHGTVTAALGRVIFHCPTNKYYSWHPYWLKTLSKFYIFILWQRWTQMRDS